MRKTKKPWPTWRFCEKHIARQDTKIAKEEWRIWQGNCEWSIPGRFILLRQRFRRTSHVACRMVGDAPSPGSYGDIGWGPERRLFRDETDHERFLERLAERVEQFHIRELRRLRTEHCTTHENKAGFARNPEVRGQRSEVRGQRSRSHEVTKSEIATPVDNDPACSP